MNVYSHEAMMAATSYLLGRAHGGMFNILEQETTADYKIAMLADLEKELRSEINRLYYVTHDQGTAE